jgi:hypothetical protein
VSDLIHEIKEDIKQEQLHNFLKNHGKSIAIFVVLFVVSLSAGLWYKDYQMNKVYKEGSEYLLAVNKMRAENVKEGIAKFESLHAGDTNYAALATLNVASYAMFNKDTAKALALYSEVFNNSEYHPYLRDLAQISYIQVASEAQTTDAATTIKELEAYIADKKTFRYTAQELLVAIFIKEKNYEKAKNIIDVVTTDPSAPGSISHRMEQYSALIK